MATSDSLSHSSVQLGGLPQPLTLDEKKAVGLVLTGNFLEYFDLMLFSHLAFVLSPYFMPKSDPVVAKLLTILTFSSSFAIRPLAAVFWGYIGDNFGRVVVLSYTTLIMAVTCFLIPNIPSYAEWGICSTLLIIACRALQGFSSAGEAKGAEIFMAEIVPHYPKIFLISVLVPITCDLGGVFATLLGSLCLSLSPDGWKVCFYIGAAIAFCSSISRKKLKETKDFLHMKKDKNIQATKVQKFFDKRNFLSLMGLNMICPTAFYFAYSFCSDLLKENAGLPDNLILFNNSCLLVVEIIFLFICARLAYWIDPFKILKFRTYTSFVLMPIVFIILSLHLSHLTIFITQLTVLLLTASFDPATPIVIRSFGIRTRFSRYSKAWALAKALMYISTGYITFAFHYWFGLGGILAVLIFFSAIFCISLYTFVPFYKMPEVYGRIKSKLGEQEEAEEDLLAHFQQVGERAYKTTHLKKWIQN